jgi:hypothetical protein
MGERQEEKIGLAVVGISSASALCNPDEAERLCFADSRRHGIVVNAVVDEVLFGNRQATVVVAAMMGEFDLNARNDSMCRQAPSPWRDGPKSPGPAQGIWALLIDGNSRQTIALTKEAYVLSVGAEGAISLNDEKDSKPLLYIKRPTGTDPDIVVANLAQDHFLTAMMKHEDRSYFSVKMPSQQKTKASQSLNEALKRLPHGGEYISKVTCCFKQVEQPREAVEIRPNDDVTCDVGPLQIVLRSH